MTGIVTFCACTEVVQVAAPAINASKSRRLTHLRDAIALNLALVMLSPIGLSIGLRPAIISRDADLVPNGLHQAPAA